MSTAKTVSDNITEIMLALPTNELIAAATDEQLESYRRVSNILANVAYLEVLRRKDSKEQK
jgi:hypothetical protein